MKAFPHQFADLGKAAAAVKVVAALIAAGQNADDEDILGEALVRGSVVGPGKPPQPIDQYLSEQRLKPIGRQGHRAQARGVRKLLEGMGLVERSDGKLKLTSLGREAASRPSASFDKDHDRAFWRAIVLQIARTGPEGRTSHPYQILLRLVAARPGITRAQCALALEARDDSPKELDRIVALAAFPEDEIRQKLGVNKPTWDDAKKVLPRFASQLRDIVKVRGGLHLSATADALAGDIHADPDIMGGEPVFRGTRIPVRSIAEMMEMGADPAEMLGGYPSLTRAQLDLAVHWVRENPPENTQPSRDNYTPRLISERRFPRRPDNDAATRKRT